MEPILNNAVEKSSLEFKSHIVQMEQVIDKAEQEERNNLNPT